ncbi:Ger(x)C family spore germination protein [Paenibacillus massiliensis]|uniref:Ger(x)C family spore germination protein n=1 Tax=Paenibacillus massiliensis TaxID=225917 RepID=UPI000417C3E2|nr:Ger(x)C family spore germination protein [Paenibacillus massiliensis]
MVKKHWNIILAFGLLLLLSGCWDKDELNEMGIALALGIDTEGELYKVSAQVVLPTGVAARSGMSQGASAVTVYEATGPTLNEAVRRLTEISPRVLYIPQLRVVVLGEEYARKGISNLVEELMRDVYSRTDFFVVVAKEHKASDILQVPTSLEKIPANQMFYSLLFSSRTWAPTTTVTIDQLMRQLVSDGIHPVLSGIQIQEAQPADGDQASNGEEPLKPKRNLRVASLALFKDDRLIGWLDETDSKGYNYIRGNVHSTFGHIVTEQGGAVGVRVLRSKTDKKAKVIDGIPHIQIKVTNILLIVEVGSTQFSLKKHEDLQKLERMGEEQLVQILQNASDVVQHKFKVDVFGYGDLIHQSDPKAWKALKQDWNHTFSELQVDYKAEVKITRVGQLGDTYLKKMRGEER